MKANITAFLLIFTMAITGSVSAELPGETLEKPELEGVYNYTRLSESEGYAGPVAGFGGATDPSAMPALKAEGYATVINLRLADEKDVDVEASRMAAEASGINYVHLPYDAGNPDANLVDAFLEIVGDPANQPVYVHCGSATRVGALWMVGRVEEDGWDMEQAGEEVRQIAAKPDASIRLAQGLLPETEQQE